MTKPIVPKPRKLKKQTTKEFSILSPSESILEEKPIKYDSKKMEKIQVTFEQDDVVKRINELEKIEHKLVEIKEEIKLEDHPELSKSEPNTKDSSLFLLCTALCIFFYVLGYATHNIFNFFF